MLVVLDYPMRPSIVEKLPSVKKKTPPKKPYARGENPGKMPNYHP
jgi:hypothetical protein